jgi:hypothetical protein
LSILIGVPIWLTIGILVAYSPEFSTQFGITGEVLSARAVMACYAGFVVGDLGFGLFSQWMKSRNRAVFWAIVLNFLMTLGYLLGARGASSDAIYVLCFLLGATGGYWAVVCTIAAEQFGTNLRATVATAVPNFIRFSLVPMNTAVLLLKDQIGLVGGALVVSVAVVAIALLSLRGLKESFGKDLDFVEPI